MKRTNDKKQITIVMIILILISFSSVPSLFSFNSSADLQMDKPIDPHPEDGSSNVSVNPELSVYISEDGNDIDVTFFNADGDIKIATIYDVECGTRVSVTWNNLEYDSIYHWYVVADDGDVQKTSETWSFETGPDIPPQIADNTAADPTTGETFLFNSTVIDNDQIDLVSIKYATDVTESTNVSMTHKIKNYYIKEINIPPDATSLNYKISAQDIKGNWKSTDNISLEVTDDDEPSIQEIDHTPKSQSLDKSVNITAEIYENRVIDSVKINITRKDEIFFAGEMNRLNDHTWCLERYYEKTGDYEYKISAIDKSGNMEVSDTKSFIIGDITKPDIKDNSDVEAFTGDYFDFKCTVTDDAGIEEVHVEYWLGYNYLETMNESLLHKEGNRWTYSIMIPSNSLKPLHYKISASDISGNWRCTEVVTIEVMDNDPPVPDAGEDRTVDRGEIVSFDASDSHDNIDIVKYEWKIQGRTFQGERINYIFKEVGEFDVTLIVYDSNRAESIKITVTVIDTEKPIADAGDDLKAEEDSEVILDGSDSSDNVRIDNYTWTINGDTKLYGKNPIYRFKNPGTYFIELNVTDPFDNYDTDTITVWVEDVTDPIADAGKNWTIYSHQQVMLNANNSFDNLEITSYEWHIENFVYYGKTVIHEFKEVGKYKATLKVEDDSGNTDTDSVYITVKDGEEPTADAGENIEVSVDKKFTISGLDSRDNVQIANYTWVIIEKNEVLYGPRPEYRFEEPGKYKIKLTVRDKNGNIGEDILRVDVKEGGEVPRSLDIILPIIIFITAVGGLAGFYFLSVHGKEEVEREEDTSEEDTEEKPSKEELIDKLKSGELEPKELENMMASSQQNLRKDIVEIYKYLEVLKSKAGRYQEDRAKEKSKEAEEEKEDVEETKEEAQEQPPDKDEVPEEEEETQEQPPDMSEISDEGGQGPPPGFDQQPDEGGEDMEEMMEKLEGSDDGEMPEGFPSPDEGEEPPSLEDATETGDISQDDIDDLFH